MNRSFQSSRSHKKNKACGYRKFSKTHQGRKILRMRRKKGRKIL